MAFGRLRWVAGAKSGSAAVAQTILSRILLLGINMVNGVYTARHFGPSGRGTQTALGMWPNLLCFVFTLGIPFALRYHARKHQEDQDSLASAALVLSVVLGFVAMLVGAALMPFMMRQYGPADIGLAQGLMVFVPLGMVTLILTSMLEVRFDFTFSNFTRYAPPFVTFAALVTLASLGALTPFSATLAYLIPPCFTSIGMAVYLFGKFSFTLVGFKHSVRRLFGYGIRIYGSDVLSTFGQQIDQFLVVGLLAAADLGVYTIALQASRVLNIFQTSLGTVLLPKMAGLPTHRIVAMVTRVARLTTALTALSGVALIVVMPFLLPGLYGHDFHKAIFISQILVVESVLASATAVLIQTFTATNRPGMATLLQMAGLGLALPLMLVLIPRLGLAGAAVSLLISTTARLAIAVSCYPLLLKVPAPGLIVTAADLRYLASALRGRKEVAQASE
jgi:O-antigen/teichoic acid export membrane protein